jgi:uncharacterized protein (TIGR00251 family)
MRLVVRLTPKASVDRIDGWGEDEKGRAYLKVRLMAPPIEGRANAGLVLFMAKALDIAKSQITLLSGDTSRLKSLEIEGLEESDIQRILK